jgi:hypothetical protein|tara:strand:- start:1388 stop:1543 length:156 start_codon:yes stop_codon:yes gene_type:complete
LRSHDINFERRKKLEAQIKEFLRGGGLIQQIPEGESKDNVTPLNIKRKKNV